VSFEISDFISRLHEKLAEEGFRSIYKEGANTSKPPELDDFEHERKELKKKITTSETELRRLMQLCKNKNVDTCTRSQRDLDKKREQTTDEAPRGSSRQHDRHRAAGSSDKTRRQVDDHEHEDDAVDITTSLSD